MTLTPADEKTSTDPLRLDDGSAVAVMGGGPAGSLFSFFLLSMAERVGLDIRLDLFEPRDFNQRAPRGCNMCGGIISESLVQLLATEGINLPASVVQRGIDAYVLHTDIGTVRIDTPLQEKRIAAVHRGAGPRDGLGKQWESFDGFLQALAVAQGAQAIPEAVTDIRLDNGKPVVGTRSGLSKTYDLLVVATGVNTSALKMLARICDGYQAPPTTKTVIREYYLGEEGVARSLGDAMHLFLMKIPRMKFAAIIPKGDCASLCMMGQDVDKPLLDSLLQKQQVDQCIRDGEAEALGVCGCSPRMNTAGARRPYADRIVFIGDAGCTRLYKDGIGAAYRTAKAAAVAAVFRGLAARDFAEQYWPACRSLARDNLYGRLVFIVTGLIQKYHFAQRAVVRMVSHEQRQPQRIGPMSTVLWDTFTGSAPYKDIFFRTLRPGFLFPLVWHLVRSLVPSRQPPGAVSSTTAVKP